jgi:hypothetical protein
MNISEIEKMGQPTNCLSFDNGALQRENRSRSPDAYSFSGVCANQLPLPAVFQDHSQEQDGWQPNFLDTGSGASQFRSSFHTISRSFIVEIGQFFALQTQRFLQCFTPIMQARLNCTYRNFENIGDFLQRKTIQII